MQDAKITSPYEIYKYVNIPCVTSYQRDNFDRFFIRVKKMLICTLYLQYLIKIYEKNKSCLNIDVSRKTVSTTHTSDLSIEHIIQEFKANMESILSI